ncbi:hypothetical protein [Burkholderia savannae]|uniref:hypothetical protein n=1 Tax=Burkholderia savannae TaxID=1637837 RepID=UPI0012F499E4|nr:hypothetical protein [Burkholderia savannae]
MLISVGKTERVILRLRRRIDGDRRSRGFTWHGRGGAPSDGYECVSSNGKLSFVKMENVSKEMRAFDVA